MLELSLDRLHIQVYNEAHPDLMLSVMILGGVNCTALPSTTVARSAMSVTTIIHITSSIRELLLCISPKVFTGQQK